MSAVPFTGDELDAIADMGVAELQALRNEVAAERDAIAMELAATDAYIELLEANL